MKNINLVFSMPVWGNYHTQLFTEITLPFLLTPGNLCGLEKNCLETSKFVVLTDSKNKKIIQDTKYFNKLQEIITVEFIDIDHLINDDNKWKIFSTTQKISVNIAKESNAALFFLQPDLLWMENSIACTINKLKEGYKAVLCPGLRVESEAIKDLIMSSQLSPQQNSDYLVDTCLKNFHPQTKLWFADGEKVQIYPSYLLFKINSNALLAYCYILHPVAVYSENMTDNFEIFDQDFIEKVVPNLDDIYISKSSKEIIFFELSSKEYDVNFKIMNGFKASEFAAYAEWHFNKHHRFFAKTPILIGNIDPFDAKIIKVKESATNIINYIDNSLRLSNIKLFFKNQNAWRCRLWRQYRYKISDLKYLFEANWIASKVPLKILFKKIINRALKNFFK